MDKIVRALPRVEEFLLLRGTRRFSFADVNNFLVNEKNQKPLSDHEKFILLSFVNKSLVKRTYRSREKSFESMFEVCSV